MESRDAGLRSPRSFQDAVEHNHCLGCGQDNGQGLQIRSRWDEDDSTLAVCEFTPLPHHSAYPLDVLNWGSRRGDRLPRRVLFHRRRVRARGPLSCRTRRWRSRRSWACARSPSASWRGGRS